MTAMQTAEQDTSGAFAIMRAPNKKPTTKDTEAVAFAFPSCYFLPFVVE